MEADREHALLPSLRIPIYRELGALTSPRGYQAQLRGAILAAQQALPVFVRAAEERRPPLRLPSSGGEPESPAAWPYRLLPQDIEDTALPLMLLDTAAHIAQGAMGGSGGPHEPALRQRMLTEQASDEERRAWECFDYGTYMLDHLALERWPGNARCAAKSCYQALAVAFGHEQLRGYDSSSIRLPDGTTRGGAKIDDRTLVLTPAADAAGCAAVALSWRGVDAPLDSDALYRFWT